MTGSFFVCSISCARARQRTIYKTPEGQWTVPREIDKKKSTCRRNASNYVALLRISYGVRPIFMVILS